MPRDKQPKQEPDIFDALFGNPEMLAKEELDSLFAAVAPNVNPAANIHALAEAAAVTYRLQKKVPPDHVQAALASTREITTIETMAPSGLRKIVDAIAAPFKGAVYDPAYAYRNRDGELDGNDQDIIDGLTDELQKDWSEEEGP